MGFYSTGPKIKENDLQVQAHSYYIHIHKCVERDMHTYDKGGRQGRRGGAGLRRAAVAMTHVFHYLLLGLSTISCLRRLLARPLPAFDAACVRWTSCSAGSARTRCLSSST